MYENLLSVKNDYVFKWIFGDNEHKDILAAFLNAVTKIPREDLNNLEILNGEIVREGALGKSSVLDVRVKLHNGKQINIEIQVAPLDSMPERSLMYLSKMYSSQLQKGQSYGTIKKCIAINIVDYMAVEPHKVHAVYHFREDESPEYMLTDKMEVHFLQLPCLSDKTNAAQADDAIIQWLTFINDQTPDIIEKLEKGGEPEMVKAIELLEAMSQSQERRMIADAQDREEHDIATRLEESEARGEAKGLELGLFEGKAEGIVEGKVQIIYNCAALNMTAEQIAPIVQLTADEVREILKKKPVL